MRQELESDDYECCILRQGSTRYDDSPSRPAQGDLSQAAEIADLCTIFVNDIVLGLSKGWPMQLQRNEEGFAVDASLLGELLNVSPSGVQELMRNNDITSRCERGEGEHAGQYRLTFFYKNRRARLNVDESGQIIRRSVIDFGDRSLPSSVRRPRGS